MIKPHTSLRSTTSRLASAGIIGIAAFSLAACEDDRVDAAVFPDIDACRAEAAKEGSWWTEQECAEQFAEAEDQHQETAPRYAERELCEDEHGGECVVEQRSNGTSVFLPLMAGYMMGNMMSNSANPAARAQPLYRTDSGRFATASGGVTMSSNRATARVPPNGFSSAASTAMAAPLTRSAVSSRGGFGAGRTASIGARGGGFGG